MLATEVRTLDAGRRVQGFLDTHAAVVGTVVPKSLRAMLDDTVTQFAGFQLAQGIAEGTAKGETVNQLGLRVDLYHRFLLQIARTAKRVLRGTPEFPLLVVPAVELRKPTFLATVGHFADAAAKYEALLIQHGQPADFLTQLHAAVVQLTASADARSRQQAQRIAATKGCAASNQAVLQIIGQIDGLLKPLTKKNPALTADWLASKKIRQTVTSPTPAGTLVMPPTTGGTVPPVAVPAPGTSTLVPTATQAVKPAV